jgi:hypothetical protein
MISQENTRIWPYQDADPRKDRRTRGPFIRYSISKAMSKGVREMNNFYTEKKSEKNTTAATIDKRRSHAIDVSDSNDSSAKPGEHKVNCIVENKGRHGDRLRFY